MLHLLLHHLHNSEDWALQDTVLLARIMTAPLLRPCCALEAGQRHGVCVLSLQLHAEASAALTWRV